MKPTFVPALVLALLNPWVSAAQTLPATNGQARMPPLPDLTTVEGVAPEPGSFSASEPISVPVPLVRIPTGPGVAPAEAEIARPLEGTDVGAEVGAVADAQLGWSSTAVGLREPSVSNVRTNRGWVIQGIVPKAARSERQGFGGFLAGFANLFNPFAPTAKGVETRGEHWYDGGVQAAPLPRGMRDERSHEPQTPIFSTDFGRGGDAPDTVAPEPVKGTVPEKP